MSMKDLAMMHALALMSVHNFFCERYNPNSVNPYEPPKLTGFTQISGRRRLTKRQRKHFKSKKQ